MYNWARLLFNPTTWDNRHDGQRLYNNPVKDRDSNGFARIYRVFCMDVDGINKGEDPFEYGIRVDGKIMNGKRANDWLEKEINAN